MFGYELQTTAETFDIHGGGSDLMFPHHENEIAQSPVFVAVICELLDPFWYDYGWIKKNVEISRQFLYNS